MTTSLIHHALAFAGTGLAAAAAAYAWIALLAAAAGRRVALRSGRQGGADRGLRPAPPPVSVLKPLCGDEPGLYENLRSFCVQSHPNFQLLFGIREAGDPAGSVVRRLQSEFPGADLRLIVDSRVHGANLKVSNLVNLLPHARHDWLVLADSDIRVSPDHLERVTAPLADPKVGVVTCLYRGAPRAGGWSRFGAKFIDDWFVPSVQVARLFGSTRFSFGATIALRRDALAAAGGFEALNDLLADDFWLGELTRRRGFRTVVSEAVATTDVSDGTFAEAWTHELRWMKTIRSVAPAGFAMAFVTFTFPVLAAGLALGRTPLCAELAAAGAVARLLLHVGQRRWGGKGASARDIALVPLRDAVLFAEWAVAHGGSRVLWRDQPFDLWTERCEPELG